MRLWHKEMIKYLPDMQLKGQYREVFLIVYSIKKFNSPKHLLVNKVMDYPLVHLSKYFSLVVRQMQAKKVRLNQDKIQELFDYLGDPEEISFEKLYADWHNERYLRQCFYNLQEKADCGRPTKEEFEQVQKAFPQFNFIN